MKKTIFIIIFSFCSFNLAFGAVTKSEALRFAKEYENEIEEKRQARAEEENKGLWRIDLGLKPGIATYEEEELNIRSDWDAFYYEAEGKLTRQSENDIETALVLSYGRSLIETETWFVSGIKYIF